MVKALAGVGDTASGSWTPHSPMKRSIMASLSGSKRQRNGILYSIVVCYSDDFSVGFLADNAPETLVGVSGAVSGCDLPSNKTPKSSLYFDTYIGYIKSPINTMISYVLGLEITFTVQIARLG